MSSGRFGGSLQTGLAFGQFVLLVVGFHTGRREVWLGVLAGIALLSLLGWMGALRRRHAITGMPTSRIASAAQGYVELHGQGRPLDLNPLHSPLSGAACLWYRYQVEHKTNEDKWETVERAESQTSFVLDDGSGQCLVDPEGAEIVTRHCRRWSEGDYRYVEWTLQQRDRIYVLGNFLTRHPSQGLEAGADVRELLAQWKTDQTGLLRRFDLDRDGQLDEREWGLARRLARGEVEKRHRELRRQPELHLVEGAPSSLYLISNHEPDQLAQRFLWMAAGQLVVFFATLGWLAWWWQQAG
ncbi:MAG: GIDE domain-containing protein [Hylemonella sp.]